MTRLAGIDLGAGNLHGMMDEDVDLDHFDIAQRAAEAKKVGFVRNGGAQGGEAAFGFGGDAGEQGRQADVGGQRLLDVAARGRHPLRAGNGRELVAQIGQDARRQLFDLLVGDGVPHLI